MLSVLELNLGFRDAENYTRRENKQLFNNIFVRTPQLDKLCDRSTFFLIGDKGAGKTAYAVYLENNTYHNASGCLKYIRETDYQKFVELKRLRHLTLSDYTNIWKVIIYLLLSEFISIKEIKNPLWSQFTKFTNLKAAIDSYYKGAFSPEILYAIQFAEESDRSAKFVAEHVEVGGNKKRTIAFARNQFQTNLFYLQRKFEDALRSVRLTSDYVLMIDGIDIRPSAIPYEEYLDCIKGLANAIWAANNDFFADIKDPGGRIRVVLLVRPDIFDKLGLQNQNSKLRDNGVLLDWQTTYTEYRESPLFQMADKLLAYQQPNNCEPGQAWDHYFPFDAPNVISHQQEISSFISFLRFSLFRPRDIIAMLAILKENFMQQKRSEHSVFNVDDFLDPMFTRKYSDYLLGEVKDHLSFYFPTDDWEKFLAFFHYLNGQYNFSYDNYCKSFEAYVSFFSRNKIPRPYFAQTPDKFLQFLYDLNVLSYVMQTDTTPFFGFCFRERTPTNLVPKVRTHAEYIIHFGLRKALDLGKYLK